MSADDQIVAGGAAYHCAERVHLDVEPGTERQLLHGDDLVWPPSQRKAGGEPLLQLGSVCLGHARGDHAAEWRFWGFAECLASGDRGMLAQLLVHLGQQHGAGFADRDVGQAVLEDEVAGFGEPANLSGAKLGMRLWLGGRVRSCGLATHEDLTAAGAFGSVRRKRRQRDAQLADGEVVLGDRLGTHVQSCSWAERAAVRQEQSMLWRAVGLADAALPSAFRAFLGGLRDDSRAGEQEADAVGQLAVLGAVTVEQALESGRRVVADGGVDAIDRLPIGGGVVQQRGGGEHGGDFEQQRGDDGGADAFEGERAGRAEQDVGRSGRDGSAEVFRRSEEDGLCDPGRLRVVARAQAKLRGFAADPACSAPLENGALASAVQLLRREVLARVIRGLPEIA